MKIISFEKPTIETVDLKIEIGRKPSENIFKQLVGWTDPIYDIVKIAGRVLNGRLLVESDIQLTLGTRFDMMIDDR